MYARKTVCHVESKCRLGDGCALRHSVAIFKAPEYSRNSPCQQHTLWWGSDIFASPSCGVVKSTILFPSTGGLFVFLFLALTYDLIGHILRRKCLLKLVIEGKIEGTRRQGRRRNHLVDDFKETRRYWKLKDEALDRILRATRFEKYCGPLARHYVMIIIIIIIVMMIMMEEEEVILKVRCRQEGVHVEGRILLDFGS
jgi:hypothetical protein